MDITEVVQMQQVHGNSVVRVSVRDSGKTIPNCDALISNDPNVTLSVRVADCLSISLIDEKSHSFGLIHAGWRGLTNRIIGKSIRRMSQEFGSKSSDVIVNIGPHICQRHFEVKDDVLSKFNEYPGVILLKNGKNYLDLGKIAELQLISLGIKKENITIDPRCTFEDMSLYSYRRDHTSGRNMIYC